MGITLSVYMLIGFYSIIFASHRLMRPGVSTEMRKLFLKNYVIYVLALIFLQLCNLLSNYELFKPEIFQEIKGSMDLNHYRSKIENATFTMGFVMGIILALIRSNDPYFRFVISQQFYMCFGIIIEEQKGLKSGALSTFLSSSLNIELVYIILAGITRFSSSQNPKINLGNSLNS